FSSGIINSFRRGWWVQKSILGFARFARRAGASLAPSFAVRPGPSFVLRAGGSDQRLAQRACSQRRFDRDVAVWVPADAIEVINHRVDAITLADIGLDVDDGESLALAHDDMANRQKSIRHDNGPPQSHAGPKPLRRMTWPCH